MEQREFSFFMLWDSPKTVDIEIVKGFSSDHEAMKYGFEHRPDPGGRTIAWLAHHLGVARQRLSRMLGHGDFKLPASKVHLFDFFVGNTAYSQYIELQKESFKRRRVEAIQRAIEEKVAA